MLQQIAVMTAPVLVVNDTRVDRHHGCYAVISAICALLERNGMRAAHFWPAHSDWRTDPAFDRALKEVRLVVVNGEGTIHHDRPTGRCLLEVAARARARGVPVVLVNVGWEANGSDFLALLGDFDLVAARDSLSAERMRAGAAEVRVVPDLSFWYARTHAPQLDPSTRAGIGFTDNVDRFKSLSLEQLRRACGGHTLAICHGETSLGGWLGFLREGVGLRRDAHHPLRLAALLELRHRLWRAANANTDEFLVQIARLELLVSGRFHACTLALATGTPVIARSSNTGKISALFHDAGLESWRGEIPLNPAAVHEARAYGWSKDERAALDAYLAAAVTQAESLFADLAKLVFR